MSGVSAAAPAPRSRATAPVPHMRGAPARAPRPFDPIAAAARLLLCAGALLAAVPPARAAEPARNTCLD